MSAEYPIRLPEGIRQESLVITKQSLYDDNNSPEAFAAREAWDEARKKGELRGFVRCSDARLKTVGEKSVSLGNIAAATEPKTPLLSSRGLNSLIALSHIDGDTIKEGQMPSGCGGLGAYEHFSSDSKGEEIGEYVFEHVASKDAVVQAIVTAKKLALSSNGKRSIAVVEDHRDYTMYPIAHFRMAGGQLIEESAVSDEEIEDYSPERLYANGIPTLDESRIPDVFAEMLEENRLERLRILEKYPDLKKLQKVQKPRMILFSTDMRSARVRYPNISLPPGSVFKLHIPREKTEGGITVEKDDLAHSLNQLSYPIKENALENYDDPTKPFSNTDRIIIETGDYDESVRLAEEALKKPWMKKWIKLPDRKIIVVQTNEGRSIVIGEM